MADENAASVGEVPAAGGRDLGPFFFPGYADEPGDHPAGIPLRALVFSARRP